MDNQDPRKITIPGQENHVGGGGGVHNHVCRKCGWSFPNPHPSAKHRRSHKKICGTIEGYKSIDSEGNPNLNVSDSDDDLKTPSPKILKKTSSGVGSGSIGEISNRSEYEVFSDAVTEFSDTGPSPGIEEHLEDSRESVSITGKIVEHEPITALLDKESGATESAAVPEDVTVCPSRLMETKGGVKGDEKDLEENLLVSPSESARETSEGGYKLEEMNGNSSDVLIADGIVILKEEKSDSSSHTMSQRDISPEVQSDVNIGDTPQIQVNTASGLDVSGDTIEGCDTKGEGNSSEHFILDPDSIPVVNYPEIMVEGFKDHKALQYNQHITLATYEPRRDEKDDKDPVSEVHSNSESRQLAESVDVKGEGNSSEHFILVPDSIPVVNHPEIMVEGFKDPKALQYNQHITLATYEPRRDEKDDKDLVSEVHSNSESRQLAESVGVSLRGVKALKDGSSELPVEGDPIQVGTDIHGIKDNTDEKLLSDKLGAPADLAKTEIVSSFEEQASQDSCDPSSKKILPEHGTTVPSDTDLFVSPMEADDNQTVNFVRGDDADNHEKATTEACYIENNDCREGAMEERETNPFSRNDPCDFQNNRISNVAKGDNAGDHDKVENKISGTTSSHTESQVAEGGGLDDFVICTDAVSTPLDQVSDSSRVGIEASQLVETHSNLKNFQDEDSKQGAEEPEINSNKSVELLHKTSENQMMKEPLLLPLEAASVQSSVIVEDEHARVLGGCVSGIVSESLQEQGDKSFSKQQPGVSAADVSVDSLSQTDSLEGNWGSVSDATVLSTLSDALAVVDAEALPSTLSQASAVAEKANMREGHHSDKSDFFEPPSFMTLVEPRVGAHPKIDASEIQTVQNSQQSNTASSQAGWFPSLTHVANDSQGRKKNEEIIAKVKNWSAGKQHTPLKSLLGEANAETKQKSSNAKENSTPMVQKDGIATKNNGNLVTTVNSILGPDPPVAQAAKEETGQEWNSPARYPAEIKRERRKAKGKPYWVPFVCCSSIN